MNHHIETRHNEDVEIDCLSLAQFVIELHIVLLHSYIVCGSCLLVVALVIE